MTKYILALIVLIAFGANAFAALPQGIFTCSSRLTYEGVETAANIADANGVRQVTQLLAVVDFDKKTWIMWGTAAAIFGSDNARNYSWTRNHTHTIEPGITEYDFNLIRTIADDQTTTNPRTANIKGVIMNSGKTLFMMKHNFNVNADGTDDEPFEGYSSSLMVCQAV